MPDTLPDIVRARACAGLVCVTSDDVVPGVVLEEPYGFGKEAGCDEVEEASTDD